MLFHWTYKPQGDGPLFAKLRVKDDAVVLQLFVKHRDRHYKHNCFLDIDGDFIDIQKQLLDDCRCPVCKRGLYFRYEDKYNKLYCINCEYAAWSDKIYDPSDWYD